MQQTPRLVPPMARPPNIFPQQPQMPRPPSRVNPIGAPSQGQFCVAPPSKPSSQDIVNCMGDMSLRPSNELQNFRAPVLNGFPGAVSNGPSVSPLNVQNDDYFNLGPKVLDGLHSTSGVSAESNNVQIPSVQNVTSLHSDSQHIGGSKSEIFNTDHSSRKSPVLAPHTYNMPSMSSASDNQDSFIGPPLLPPTEFPNASVSKPPLLGPSVSNISMQTPGITAFTSPVSPFSGPQFPPYGGTPSQFLPGSGVSNLSSQAVPLTGPRMQPLVSSNIPPFSGVNTVSTPNRPPFTVNHAPPPVGVSAPLPPQVFPPVRPGMPPPLSSMPPVSSGINSQQQSGMPHDGISAPPLPPAYMQQQQSGPVHGSKSPVPHPSAPVVGAPANMIQQPQTMHSQTSTMSNRYPGAQSGSYGNYSSGAQTQGRRLNPDDMPSPLQVMDEDQKSRSGEFVTNSKGLLPPLVTTDFIVRDGGNASPRFIRSTMYSVPATPDMMKQTAIPFGLVISPMTDQRNEEAPIYLGTSVPTGPIRCNRCKAYMSPFMMFMDGGRRYQCQLCRQVNEVPPDYYCHMDSQGARADKYQRPELCLGTYEYLATAEYCRNKELPKEPAYIFVMEMSQLMLQRGVVPLLCENMKSLLEHLPVDEVGGQRQEKHKIKVGFITYDSSVHYYKLTGQAPEMCIICDREDMFVPMPDGVLCDVEEVEANILRLMETIPQNFQNTKETSGVLHCAIQAGMSALKAAGRAGKLFVFHSSLPQAEGPGKLKNREDRKILGSDKEKAILSPQTNSYNNLAQELVGVGCGVDLYIFNDSYVDLATIGQTCKITGGQSYKYTYFQVNKDGPRLLEDLKMNIGRRIALDTVMRVRTSTGVRPVEFYGHFYMSNTTDIEMSCVDASKALAIEIKHDDKLTEEDGVYIQAALLFTSVSGQRRLRIMNLSFNTCTQMAELYKNCDLDTLMNFLGKQSIVKFLETSAKQVKENLVNRTAQILACYRKNCASPSSAGQLILPELLKLLPLYGNNLSKCDALSGGQDLSCDEKSWLMYMLSTMPVDISVAYFYPRLIPLANESQEFQFPATVRTSYEKLRSDGVFLLENGLFIFVWVGSNTPPSWMTDVFGVSAPHQLDPVMAELPELDNNTSKCVRQIIACVRQERKSHMRMMVVPQQGKHEIIIRNYLVEDKGLNGSPSYVDFLCHIHKEIRALLS